MGCACLEMKMHKFQSFPLAYRFPRLFAAPRKMYPKMIMQKPWFQICIILALLIERVSWLRQRKGCDPFLTCANVMLICIFPAMRLLIRLERPRPCCEVGFLDSILMFCCMVLTVPNVNFPQVPFRVLPRAFVCFGSLNWSWLNIHALSTFDRCFAEIDCNQQTLRNLKDNFVTQ